MVSIASLIRLLVLATIVLQAGAVVAQPVRVGAVVSQTGPHADLAEGYARGLRLWSEEVNARGGLLGRPVDLRLLDDGSLAVRAGELYRQLIGEGTELLIGPYGTAPTLLAAAEAESAGRVLVNGAGWSSSVHAAAPRWVFQSAVPHAAFGRAAVELARELGAKRLIVLARDDPAAVEMASAAVDAATKAGLAAPPPEVYAPALDDFIPLALKGRSLQAEAWLAFGEPRDGAELLKALKKLGVSPRLFFVRGAADARFIERVGQDAESTVAAVRYDPRLGTPGNAGFVAAYRARWGAAPGPAAAEGYAAGTVLAAGVAKARSLDARPVRDALATLATDTVLGQHRTLDTGEQAGARPVLLQIVRGRPEPVWPLPWRSAEPAPFTPWKERKLLRRAAW